jgi:hypothetical protein
MAWFCRAAAAEDLAAADGPGARAEAERDLARSIHRLRALGVTRADPDPRGRAPVEEVVPQAPVSLFG